MNSVKNDLFHNHFLFLPGFISATRAKDISVQFSNTMREQDTMVQNSTYLYNFMPALELLCEKTPEISKIVNEYVLPTYCYARKYQRDCIMHRHIDRHACEISVSVHLNCEGDSDWPLCIQTPKEGKLAISFEPGDAVLYYGVIAPHWRQQYNGQWYDQLFLHYVRSQGMYFDEYFDQKHKSAQYQSS
jgi:hypothetical protein